MKKLRGLLWVVVFVFVDQYTKYLAKSHLEYDGPISIINKVFKLQYLENTGAAFGIFKNQMSFFIIITLITLAVILFFYGKIPYTKHYAPLRYILILITSGAIGNFIDRLRYNYVVDFLYFELIDFPIFNVADCYVTISAVLLMFLILFYYKEADFDFLSKKKDQLDKT